MARRHDRQHPWPRQPGPGIGQDCGASLGGEAAAAGFGQQGIAEVDLGYALLPEACGSGFATEAGAAVLADAWTRLARPRVLAIVTPGHRDSLRVLDKLGFRDDGALRAGPDAEPLLRLAVDAPRR